MSIETICEMFEEDPDTLRSIYISLENFDIHHVDVVPPCIHLYIDTYGTLTYMSKNNDFTLITSTSLDKANIVLLKQDLGELLKMVLL